jgi:hypothetical protein
MLEQIKIGEVLFLKREKTYKGVTTIQFTKMWDNADEIPLLHNYKTETGWRKAIERLQNRTGEKGERRTWPSNTDES